MKRRSLYALTAVLIGMRGSAWAQAGPSKPIRAIVPFAAGSTTDIIARVVFDQLATQLHQPIAVENRGGAGGTIGGTTVAKANVDGFTVLVHSSAQTISPPIIANLPYDVARDFAAVIPLGESPNVLVISPARGINTIHALIASTNAK